MPDFLSQAWLDAGLKLTGHLRHRRHANAVMQVVVRGTPTGEDVAYFGEVQGGKVVSSQLGRTPNPDFTITVPSYADAVNMAKGMLDAYTAFQNGQIQVSGDLTAMQSLMPLADTKQFTDIQQALDKVTNYP